MSPYLIVVLFILVVLEYSWFLYVSFSFHMIKVAVANISITKKYVSP